MNWSSLEQKLNQFLAEEDNVETVNIEVVNGSPVAIIIYDNPRAKVLQKPIESVPDLAVSKSRNSNSKRSAGRARKRTRS